MALFIQLINLVKAAMIALPTLIYLKVAIEISKNARKKYTTFLFRSRSFIFVGFGVISICIVTIIGTYLSDGVNDALFFVFFSFAPILFGIFLILDGFLWRIDLYDDYFIYRNFLGKKFNFKYSDITKMNLNSGFGVQIVVGKKKINVDLFVENIHLLLTKIIQTKKRKS